MIDNKILKLKIISMDEKQFIIEINSNQTILDLKTKLSAVSEVPSDRQRLIYRGKLLENDKQIHFYNLEEMSALHLIAKLNHEEETQNNVNNISSASNLNNISNRNSSELPGNLRDNFFSFNFFPLMQPVRRRRIREIVPSYDVDDTLCALTQNNYQLENLVNNKDLTYDFCWNEIKKIDFVNFENRQFTIGQ